jgi:hypothetical protein
MALFGRCATKVFARLGGWQKVPELHQQNAGKVPGLFFYGAKSEAERSD